MGCISETPEARRYLLDQISPQLKKLSRIALWFGFPAVVFTIGLFVVFDCDVEPLFFLRSFGLIALFYAMPYITAAPLYLSRRKWILSDDNLEIMGGFRSGKVQWAEMQSFTISEIDELAAHVELRVKVHGKGGFSIIPHVNEPGLLIFREYAMKNKIVEQCAAPQIRPRWRVGD